ncbi:MAG: 2OG-Fe(II) oxygenase [Deltaproteobacteria bacterium]|nr:MAG: 2OG-Fe(II) oxygenase [Deltaproteobacteria bacterium]
MHATPATAVHCAPFLDDDACEAALDALSRARWEPGRTAEIDGRAASAGPRRSCALTRDVPEDLVARVVAEVTQLGRERFGYTLDGAIADDPPHVMRYAVGDEFAWHFDCGLALPPFGTRKLSFVLQLSDPADYDGGDLELAAYQLGYAPEVLVAQRAAARTRGTLLVFGAFHVHRVTPITRGTRHALVGWLHGPPFR